METEKAYWVWLTHDFHRPGEPAEIVGVRMVTEKSHQKMEPRLELKFFDGEISYVPLSCNIYAYTIISESAVRAGRIPKAHSPCVSLYARGG